VTEDVSAEEFVPKCTIETLDVAVFPRSTRSDNPSLDVKIRQVAPDRVGDELRTVVAPDESRRTALGNEPIQNADVTDCVCDRAPFNPSGLHLAELHDNLIP